MLAIEVQLKVVGLGSLLLEGDLDRIADEVARRRAFAAGGPAGERALALAEGVTQFWRGDFARAMEVLDEVVAECEEHGDALTAVRARSVRGVVWSLRREPALVEAEFEAALEGVAQFDDPVADALLRAMRISVSEVLEWATVERELAHCRLVVERLERTDLEASVDMAEGWALASVGRFAEAVEMLRRAAAGMTIPLERSVTNARLAEVLVLDGRHDEACALAASVLEVFRSRKARYWATRSALLLSSLGNDRGGRRVGASLASIPADPAYRRLLEPSGVLVIDLDRCPAVHRNGRALTFLTRHAETAVRLLASVGAEGMDGEELSSILWPTADRTRVGQRLRTMLWQMRSGLGSDSWRLQRNGSVLTLDLTGIEVVGHLDRAAVAAEFTD